MSEQTVSKEALDERAAIVKHIHDVGNAMAKIGREHDARSMHILALAIEGGAHHGLSRAELVGQVTETLKTLRPSEES